MRELTVQLSTFLELIHIAEDFGFGKSVLYGAISEITGPISDEEIEQYASYFISEDGLKKGYSEEDYEHAIERLTEWRNNWANQDS